jgi:hypothetical protein
MAREDLAYWIQERWNVYVKKTMDQPKPWSTDPVFQTTYFTNVHRENDKVTQWIRAFHYPHRRSSQLTYNTILARFLNWPDTLEELGFIEQHDPEYLLKVLEGRAKRKEKVWSGAYVITTHGLPMSKARYLAENVMGGVAVRTLPNWHSLSAAHSFLQQLEGLGSFLAAQVVADLKNTDDHPLQKAYDWWTWAAPGPGSARGMSWFFHDDPKYIYTQPEIFAEGMKKIRQYVDATVKKVPAFCNQDLQNCLCEFDKYMRVKNGTGRSKRKYDGT